MKKRVGALACAVVMVVSLAAVPAAQAKVVLGKYVCYSRSYSIFSGVQFTYMGGFRLKSHGKYVDIRSGHRGKYKTRGKKVVFKTGPYHQFVGKADKTSDGKPVLVIKLKADPSTFESCFH